MADCAALQTKLENLVGQTNSLIQDYQNIQGSVGGATSEQLRQLLNTLLQLQRKARTLSQELTALQNEAVKLGCQEQVSKAQRAAGTIDFSLSPDMFLFEQNLRKTISSVAATEAETQKATTTQDNAGTGTSGSSPASQAVPANATPSTQTGTSTPATVTPPAGAPTATAISSPAIGASAPKPVGPTPEPKTTPVPTTKGSVGTVEYVSSLIAQQPVKGENALATACPDKAAATATVKKIITELNAQIAAQIPTAKRADGKTPASKEERDALSSQLQAANGKLSQTLKAIESKDCAKEAAGTTGPVATDPGASEANNTTPGINKAQVQAKLKDTTNFIAKKDWRVRLSLSPGADYLYKGSSPGILKPLQNTDGVIFPYTPNITISYNANYDPTSVTHSNYKIYQYLNSSVDQVNITCDFTAQDTYEATYLLAVIHFFRSVTKMFYGQDQNPKSGTPPPLCYLFGLGEFQFNAHPLVVSAFTYTLPSEVDYIRADPSEAYTLSEVKVSGARSITPEAKKPSSVFSDAIKGSLKNTRLGQGIAKLGKVIGQDLTFGGILSSPSVQDNSGFNSFRSPGVSEPTYVPTKLQIQLTCIPIVSRYDISNRFSLRDYASGQLLNGVKQSGGGIW